MNLSNLKNKEFWKQDIKKIGISDILIWIAIFLMFMASWQNIQAGNDPCSYCIVNHLPGYDEPITCREYFDNTITNEIQPNLTIQNENITYNHP